MSKSATIIVYQDDPYNSMFNVLFADALQLPDVYLVIEKEFPEKGIFKFLASRKLKLLTLGLSDRLYLKYYQLPKKIKELTKIYDKIDVLFHNAALTKPRYPLSIFKFIKSASIKLHLFYLDKYRRNHVCAYANFLREHEIFDTIMTFDPDDARELNIQLYHTPYSRLNTNRLETRSHLYFCGSNSGRLYTLYKIWSMSKSYEVSIRYDISRSLEFIPFFEDDHNIHFHQEYLNYAEIIEEIQQTNCILDITQADQSGFTLRPYEAVVYNKKLLTNNKRIFEFPFYDERYMRYFDSIADIDWKWINELVTVEYKYNDEFSPKHLINTIKT